MTRFAIACFGISLLLTGCLRTSSTIDLNDTPVPGASYVGGTGHVVSDPPGLDCQIAADGSGTGRCSSDFEMHYTVHLTATPDTGSTFTGWLDTAGGDTYSYEQTQGFIAAGGKIVTSPMLTLYVDEDRDLKVFAAFTLPPK